MAAPTPAATLLTRGHLIVLIDRIRNRESGIALYGIVPPKASTAPDRLDEIARRHRERIGTLPIDGLILYDLQDEQSRTAAERPFPFIETLDAFDYSHSYLEELDIPRIIYRAVGKYSARQLEDFHAKGDSSRELTVYVGAASTSDRVAMSMADAYQHRAGLVDPLPLGGVVIPERHQTKGNEHLRVLDKMEKGCEFFVSQGVYDLDASRNFLSDYFYECQRREVQPVPILFTVTPCGSHKTLQFMKWLGISIPRWLENELAHSSDILTQSVDVSEYNYRALQDFASLKGLPIGCNVESVAVRKAEVDAAIELLHRLVV